MENEAELKFAFQPGDLPRLRSLLKFESPASGRAHTRRLAHVYFDTPDRRLLAEAIALRVQKAGRGYVQRVENLRDRPGLGSAKTAWTGRVPSDKPVPSTIGDVKLRDLVVRAGGEALAPVFRTEVERTTRDLVLDGGGEVRLDIDIGEISAAGTARPVCELGLGLKAGAPHRLYDLALEIQPALGLSLCSMSEAARGYALLTGEPPGSMKAPDLDLSGDITVEQALVGTVRHCLDHVMANEASVLESEDPEGVHQMRVALRRLRSALRLFRSVLPAPQYGTLVEGIKWLAGELSATRDWDVLVDEIVGPVAARLPEETAFEVLLARLHEERRRCRHAARDAIRSPRYTRFLLQSGGWLAKRAWRDQPPGEASARLDDRLAGFADDVFARRHDKVCARGRRFESLSAGERHRLRIDVKRLRYATDFFGALYCKDAVTSYAAKLANIQDALGYRNDVAVARDLVKRLGDMCTGDDARQCRHAGAIVMGWHTRAMAQSETALARSIDDFVACRPFWVMP